MIAIGFDINRFYLSDKPVFGVALLRTLVQNVSSSNHCFGGPMSLALFFFPALSIRTNVFIGRTSVRLG